jgi:hypothetical protein
LLNLSGCFSLFIVIRPARRKPRQFDLHKRRVIADNGSRPMSNHLPMTKFMCTLAAAVFVPGFAHGAFAQSQAYTPTMAFEVASIRQSSPDPHGYTVRGGFSPANSSHVSTENFSFWNLVLWAYAISPNRIVGLDRLPERSRRQRDQSLAAARDCDLRPAGVEAGAVARSGAVSRDRPRRNAVGQLTSGSAWLGAIR